VSKVGDTIREIEQGMAAAPEWAQDLFGGDSFWNMMLSNGLQVFGVGLAGWLLAVWFERRHLRSLSIREAPLQNIRVNNLKNPPPCEPEASTLLVGSVVVAHDYFRTLIIAIKKLIGGNIGHYERLVHRGRREALIRLKEEADFRGLDMLINVRFGTSTISGRFLHAIEMVAYGTGIKSKR
jgi:uncharacterized protein YbjQ (UPF0145 family)